MDSVLLLMSIEEGVRGLVSTGLCTDVLSGYMIQDNGDAILI
jgi:hypothetical protein